MLRMMVGRRPWKGPLKPLTWMVCFTAEDTLVKAAACQAWSQVPGCVSVEEREREGGGPDRDNM